MPRALFLSDNEFLNDIYTINLSSYLDIDLEVDSSLENAMSKASSGNYDILISLSLIDENDVGKEMASAAQKNDLPVVIVGEKSEVSNTPEVITVPGNLNIQFFLRSIARVLGITAEEMAEKAVGEYFPMGLKVLLGMTNAPCDVFYKVSKPGKEEIFTKVWSEGQAIDQKFEKFKNLEILNLYIPASKRLEITNKVTSNISTKLSDKSLNQDEKLEAVESGFELVAQNLFSNEEVAEEVLEISGQCVDAINDVINSEPSLGDLLKSMLSNKSRFIYMHSVLTTFVCQYILDKIPWGSKEHVEKVSYVLFFHDMFLVPIYNDHQDIKYEEDLIFSPELSDEEKDVIINHAKEAGNALKRLPKAPMGADTITTQHHGATNGVGFAMDPGDDVSPLAKIILIGEAFVDEFLKAKDDGEEPVIGTILEELQDRYTNKSYHKIIGTLEKIRI
ncbi:MAG: hypothetical protein CME70_19830 [Halobacteriovorax sp.]|nr:hypothetical protein [Halobacteriovorax sp.]|tara:strand:- start:29792 stop:31135 length:1344 start_codon:yes stop_codon:yes gene_type:complete